MHKKPDIFDEATKNVQDFHERTKRHTFEPTKSDEYIEQLYEAHKKMQTSAFTNEAQIATSAANLAAEFNMPLAECLINRFSTRHFQNCIVPLDRIQKILTAAFCHTSDKNRQEAGTITTGRPYPSPGGLYAIQHYFLQRNTPDSDTWTLYSFNAISKKFFMINKSVTHDKLNAAIQFPMPVTSVYIQSMQYGFVVGKYHERGYRLALLEAGAAMQNLMLACAAQNIGTLAYGGMINDAIDRIIGCNGLTEASVNAVFMGYPAPIEPNNN